ncbi:MAG TPA: TolC family protein [Cytophagales bacterium]|nr:TolC family protein [Cytophagales bacterium]
MLKIIGLTAGVLLTSFSLFAQDSLSLADAIQIGLDRNFSIQIEKLNVEIAKNNNNWGEAGRYPSINLITGQNNSVLFRKPTNPFSLGGTNTVNNFANQIDLEWILFNGFRVNINKSRLFELERLSQGNVRILVENTIQNIILAYNIAVLENKRLEVRNKVLKLSKERYELVKLRRQVGSAILFDVLQEENAYLTDSSNVLSQTLNYRNSIRNLNELMNQDLNQEYFLTDSLTMNLTSYELEDLNQKMLSSNSNLRNQFINQSLLKYNTRLAQADQYPVVSLNLGANSSNDRLRAPARVQEDSLGVTPSPTFSTNYGYSYGGYANLSLRFNIFNGGQIKRSIQNARVQERIGDLSIKELQLSLTNDLIQFYELFNLRKNLVQLANANIKAAELNVSLANDRYKNGYLSSIDYRIIQLNYQNTALMSLEAIYNVIETHTDLLRITGGIIEESIE